MINCISFDRRIMFFCQYLMCTNLKNLNFIWCYLCLFARFSIWICVFSFILRFFFSYTNLCVITHVIKCNLVSLTTGSDCPGKSYSLPSIFYSVCKQLRKNFCKYFNFRVRCCQVTSIFSICLRWIYHICMCRVIHNSLRMLVVSFLGGRVLICRFM